jgi:hypothetical protein
VTRAFHALPLRSGRPSHRQKHSAYPAIAVTTCNQRVFRPELIANELAFDGAGSHCIATGSRYLQMMGGGFASQWNASQSVFKREPLVRR